MYKSVHHSGSSVLTLCHTELNSTLNHYWEDRGFITWIGERIRAHNLFPNFTLMLSSLDASCPQTCHSYLCKQEWEMTYSKRNCLSTLLQWCLLHDTQLQMCTPLYSPVLVLSVHYFVSQIFATGVCVHTCTCGCRCIFTCSICVCIHFTHEGNKE